MTPAQQRLLLTTYEDLTATDAQYFYFAAGAGFNGLPENCTSFTEWMGVVSKCKNKKSYEKMSDEDIRVLVSRDIRFGKLNKNGWDKDNDTPQNNAKIIEFAIQNYEKIFRFFTKNEKGLAKIEKAKKYLSNDLLLDLNKRLESEDAKNITTVKK